MRIDNGRFLRESDLSEGGADDRFYIQDLGGKGVVRFFAYDAATGGRVRMLANGGGWDVDVGWLTGEVRVSRVRAP